MAEPTPRSATTDPIPRLGLLVPSVNSVTEDDARHHLPDLAVHVGRIAVGQGSAADLRTMTEALPAAVSLVADAPIDALGFACTAGSMIGPLDERATLRVVAEAAGHVPVTTTTTALHAAFAALGVRRLTFWSPYPAFLHEAERRALVEAGLAVTNSRCLDLAAGGPAAEVAPAQIVRMVRETDTDRADAVLVGCANTRATEVVAELEATLGKPVLTANLVLFWHLLALIGDRAGDAPARLPGALAHLARGEGASDVGRP